MRKISVIVPCRGDAPYLAEALESAASQKEDVEILVAADGPVPEKVRQTVAAFKDAALIESLGTGAGAGRNTGLSRASGEYVQFLDSDDVLAGGKLAAQSALLEETGADIAYGAWQELIYENEKFAAGKIRDRETGPDPETAFFTGLWFPCAAYLMKKKTALETGGFKEYFYAEDARFLFDCARLGARFVKSEGLAAFYRRHPEQNTVCRDFVKTFGAYLQNAEEVEAVWAASGKGINGERKAALLQVYGMIAVNSCGLSRDLFERASSHLRRIDPGYVPGTERFRGLAKWIGYRPAAYAAAFMRRFRKKGAAFFRSSGKRKKQA